MSKLDYGPLEALIGTWEGDKGLDIAPEPDGEEEHPYYETITFQAVGDVTNAEAQTLSVLRYLQVVTRKEDNEVFHDETGYWMWDPSDKTIMHSLAIPRGVCLLAGGTYGGENSQGEIVLSVSAKEGDSAWGIVQSPFMKSKAKTVEFNHDINVKGKSLQYSETTVLDIYGKTFDHIDKNELIKIN